MSTLKEQDLVTSSRDGAIYAVVAVETDSKGTTQVTVETVVGPYNSFETEARHFERLTAKTAKAILADEEAEIHREFKKKMQEFRKNRRDIQRYLKKAA